MKQNEAKLMLMKHTNASETKSSTSHAYETESASLYYSWSTTFNDAI